MNARLAADLGRWERGELRADELAHLHPDGDTSDLVQAHAWLSLATSVADEEPALSFEEIEARLDIDLDAEAERDRERERRVPKVPFFKLAAAFVAGALANPVSPAAQGFANVGDAARDAAEAVVEEVVEVFDPIVPSQNVGLVVVQPIEEQKVSVVLPAPQVVAPDASAPVLGVDVPQADATDDSTPAGDEPAVAGDEGAFGDPAPSPDPAPGGATAPDEGPAPEPAPQPDDGEPSTDPPRASRGASHHATASWTPPGLAPKPTQAGKGGLAAVAAAVIAANDGAVDHRPPSEPPGHARGRSLRS